jgi:hypothetical protein
MHIQLALAHPCRTRRIFLVVCAVWVLLSPASHAMPCEVTVTPERPSTTDSVTLTLTCGVEATSCVPTYEDLHVDSVCVSCDWSGSQESYYPPRRELRLSWTAVPAGRGTTCVDTPTPHGPLFRLPALESGTYTVMHQLDTLACFDVVPTGEGRTIGGR